MHYNHFTIEYIEAIQSSLKITVNSNGKASFIPSLITCIEINELKEKLNMLWKFSESAIDIVRNKQDAKIQSGLFGLVNELDTALKVGFLISDRVILIDYLFERLLQKKVERINLTHLGVIASSLVELLPLAKKGRVVIIPSPFGWNPDSKNIIKEASTRITLTPDIMSLLNMLSITRSCNLHPFTIAESEESYSIISKNLINHVNTLQHTDSVFAYEGILGALLSERLLTNTPGLNVALEIPIYRYYEIISMYEGFHLSYLSKITQGGELSGQNNIEEIQKKLTNEINSQNKKLTSTALKIFTGVAGVSGSMIGFLSGFTVLSNVIAITGGALSLSSTLTGLINAKESKDNPIINVFRKLSSS